MIGTGDFIEDASDALDAGKLSYIIIAFDDTDEVFNAINIKDIDEIDFLEQYFAEYIKEMRDFGGEEE